jgi:signal transduction histidine kinase
MFFSSESAINILNDLLQYEHIEAGMQQYKAASFNPSIDYIYVCHYIAIGTFRLSCEALSLVNVLENKFGWANVMASQKGVAFRVNDTSLATEFGHIATSLTAGGIRICYGMAYWSYSLHSLHYLSHTDEESGFDMVPDESLSAQRSLILYMDIYRIEQVIRNLITNAVGQHNNTYQSINQLDYPYFPL